MGTISFTGGSAAQQAVIQAAHGDLATALAAALSDAALGGADLLSWFGDQSQIAIARVTTVLTNVQGALAGYNFSYDLTNPVDDIAYLPVMVTIVSIASPQIALTVSPLLWSNHDETGAQRSVALGLCQQICATCAGPDLNDVWDALDSYRIRQLAQRSPPTAQIAPFAYMYFVDGYLPAPTPPPSSTVRVLARPDDDPPIRSTAG